LKLRIRADVILSDEGIARGLYQHIAAAVRTMKMWGEHLRDYDCIKRETYTDLDVNLIKLRESAVRKDIKATDANLDAIIKVDKRMLDETADACVVKE